MLESSSQPAIPDSLKAAHKLLTRELADLGGLGLPCKDEQEHVVGLDAEVGCELLHSVHSHSLAREAKVCASSVAQAASGQHR